jgi:hypothetical protein
LNCDARPGDTGLAKMDFGVDRDSIDHIDLSFALMRLFCVKRFQLTTIAFTFTNDFADYFIVVDVYVNILS